ncbi:hypothetical protein BKA93DRAFT_41345 [Sparassis latifolia]
MRSTESSFHRSPAHLIIYYLPALHSLHRALLPGIAVLETDNTSALQSHNSLRFMQSLSSTSTLYCSNPISTRLATRRGKGVAEGALAAPADPVTAPPTPSHHCCVHSTIINVRLCALDIRTKKDREIISYVGLIHILYHIFGLEVRQISPCGVLYTPSDLCYYCACSSLPCSTARSE